MADEKTLKEYVGAYLATWEAMEVAAFELMRALEERGEPQPNRLAAMTSMQGLRREYQSQWLTMDDEGNIDERDSDQEA